MMMTPEDVIREVLTRDSRQRRSEGGSREALAAFDTLVGERDDLAERLQGAEAEIARLRRIEEAAVDVLSGWGGRRSATPWLAAIAELRAALREQGWEG
jgi:hypothetical protein